MNPFTRFYHDCLLRLSGRSFKRVSLSNGALLATCCLLGGLLVQPASAQQVRLNNGIPSGTPGHFSVGVQNAGDYLATGTVVRASNGAISEEGLFKGNTFIDINGMGVRLSAPVLSALTMSVALVGPNQARSEGNFVGSTGNTVFWTATTTLAPGAQEAQTEYTFHVDSGTLGTIRLTSYADPDIVFFNDDLITTRGTAAGGDLQVITFDNSDHYGMYQGGAYDAAGGLASASFAGWFGAAFPDVDTVIASSTAAFSPTGSIGTNLATTIHPVTGLSYGPNDITTALAWDVDPNASNSLIIASGGLIADAVPITITGSVSGVIWMDFVGADGNPNNDDLAANGVNGAQVTLFRTAPNVVPVEIATSYASAGNNGYYEFTGIPLGEYEVVINQSTLIVPAEAFTTPTMESFSFIDDFHLDVDFGFTPVQSDISGTVWYDLVGQDGDPANDPLATEGIAGASVTLSQIVAGGVLNPVQTVSSGANGAYAFDTVFGGNYLIQIDASTLPEAAPSFTTPREYEVALTSSGPATMDFGILRFASISGVVWFDENQNGLREEVLSNYGLGNVAVNIYRIAGGSRMLETTVFTDASGNYASADLVAGEFEVEPDLATLTFLNPSTSVPTTASPQSFDLNGGGTARGLFGLFDPAAPGRITGTVWFDVVGGDGNANNDNLAINGLPGIKIRLFTVDPETGALSFYADTLTGAVVDNGAVNRGFYSFEAVPAGPYTVALDFGSLPDTVQSVTAEFQYDFELPARGLFDADFGVSGAPPGSTPTAPEQPIAGDGSISGTIWQDFTIPDGDPSNEQLGGTGVFNARVNLFSLSAGGVRDYVATASSVNLGFFSFLELLPGDYVVELDLASFPQISVDQFTTPTEYTVSVSLAGSVGDINFGLLPAPTAAGVSIEAASGLDGVRVSWELQETSQDLGYQLRDARGAVTEILEAGQGSYTVTLGSVDGELELVVIASDLSTETFGPVAVSARDPLEVDLAVLIDSGDGIRIEGSAGEFLAELDSFRLDPELSESSGFELHALDGSLLLKAGSFVALEIAGIDEGATSGESLSGALISAPSL